MTDRKPTSERGIGDAEHVRVGPLFLVARRNSASVYSMTIKPALDVHEDAANAKYARRVAIDAARKIVAEWSSELDRLAEECR